MYTSLIRIVTARGKRIGRIRETTLFRVSLKMELDFSAIRIDLWKWVVSSTREIGSKL